MKVIDDRAAQQAWIRCDEQLPSPGQDVLICAGESAAVAWLDHDGLGFSNSDWWWPLSRVRAWMPLPEPPEGE